MIDVIKTNKIGIILIEIRNKIFLLLRFIFNFGFFNNKIIIIKNGIKTIICLIKKIKGFLKWSIRNTSLIVDLLRP